ncbi:MAG: response regulator transcription factor [Anaerolineae bacterium]
MTTILIVEDERNLSNLIRRNLEDEGYDVWQVFDGTAALDAITIREPDLVILDIMLPGMDGLQICRQVRQRSIVPVLMLTARAEEIDRVLGLEVGADDYLTKPFSMRELTARVRAILRRVEMMRTTAEPVQEAVLTVADLRLDPTTHEVTLENRPVDLTPKEFALLYHLSRHPGRVFSRAYLLDEIWGYSAEAYDRTVDTHIYRLRQKLGAESEIASRIVSVRGIGYKFQRD